LKSALITGITGQDGSYLAEFLLEKGYEIHGIRRRGSTQNTERLNQLDDSNQQGTIRLHYGDLADGGNISRLIQEIQPDEVYNLAAQSDVGVSFLQPEYTGEVNGLGVVRLLDAIREVDLDTRIYQASTSELFGDVENQPQDESTPFHPRSPYGTAKLYAYWITQNYREAYDMFISNGILFNHESPRRGENFVTRKITLGTAEIDHGRESPIQLGNLDARRDWGFAPEYVRAMWLMLQEDTAEDYVVATGDAHTVREFVTRAFECIGRTVEWEGDGVNERGYDRETGQELVTVDADLFRPADVNALVGDASKIQRELGWEPETTFSELVEIMVESDLERVRQ
jgi:GDPmannose 4,6-dehydratase